MGLSLVPVEISCTPGGGMWTADARPERVSVLGQPVMPGLAITPAILDGTYSGWWVITHLPTGLALGPKAMCMVCCRTIAQQLSTASDVDWTQTDVPTIAEDPAANAGARRYHAAARYCMRNHVARYVVVGES